MGKYVGKTGVDGDINPPQNIIYIIIISSFIIEVGKYVEKTGVDGDINPPQSPDLLLSALKSTAASL